MSATYTRPTGDVSRRLHGVILVLERRLSTARDAAADAEAAGQVEFAASLRGKAHGYGEALDLLRKVEQGRPLRRHRWFGRGA